MVRYSIISTESATIAPKTQKTPWAKAYAISGAVAEWTEDVEARKPGVLKKVISGLFGASKIIREHIESDISLIDVEIDYDSGPKVPKSYEGVSGGALWELHTELNGTNVVDVQKKLVGAAFRQTRASDQHLITCNGIQSISALTASSRNKWRSPP